jgi:hypothetical protein
MTVIRFSLFLVLLAGTAFANGTYVNLDAVDFINRPGAYEGRVMKVTAQVCAINADGNSLQLFDPIGKVMIDVNLTHLKKSERDTLASRPIRRVVVYGLAELRNGRITIDAQRVDPQTSIRIPNV